MKPRRTISAQPLSPYSSAQSSPGSSSLGPSSLESLLAALATLRHAPEGPAVLQQIEQGRQVRNGLLAVVERAFLHFLQSAMTRYEKRSGVDATARLKAKLIARRAAAMAGADTSSHTATTALQDAAELE